MYDVAGLIAPRPLFVESGEKDDIFPIAASRESFARVKKVYEVVRRRERDRSRKPSTVRTASGA